MGELGEPDHDDSNKKEEHTEGASRPPSYESLEIQSMTSVNEKIMTEDEAANAGKEVVETNNEKEIDKNNKNEAAEKEDKQKSSDPPPVGLIELVIILSQFP